MAAEFVDRGVVPMRQIARLRGDAAAALACAVALSASGAAAQTDVPPARAASPPVPAVASSDMRPLWEIGVGAAALRTPDYRGSDESRNWLLPLPYIVYRGQWLRADRDGARAVLVDNPAAELDLSVGASVPTRSRDNLARAGMPDLKPTLEVGPNLNIALLRGPLAGRRLELRLPLRAAFTVERSPRSAGVVFSPHLNLDLQGVAGGWNVGVLTGPLFADRRYHRRLYGVEPDDATPLRPAYVAGSGYSGWQTLVGVSRRHGSTWVGAFLRHDNLRGASFAGSPLLRRENAWMMGVGLSWVLAKSNELVVAPE